MTESSTGGWIETVAPGISTTLDAATMPHALVSEADGTFTFKKLAWADRDVGDDNTNPVPSFVGKRLNDVFFARNRLGFLTGENVVMSRAGGLYYTFFREKAVQVLDTDPIDIGATDKDIAVLRSALPFNNDIVLFAGKTQFRLTSGQDIMTPKSVELKPVSKYESFDGCAPVNGGKAIYFVLDRGATSSIQEWTIDGSTADATDTTEHVPNYIPANVIRVAFCKAEKMLCVLTKADRKAVYVYSFYDQQNQRLQASWSRWSFDGDVLDMGVFASDLVLLVQRDDGLYLEAMSLAAAKTDDGASNVTYLDRRITEAECSGIAYDATTKLTSFTLPYTVAGDFEVWTRPERGGAPSRRLHSTLTSATTVVVSGGHTNSKLFFGVPFKSLYEFSEQFLRDGGGASRTDGHLKLRRFAVELSNTDGVGAEVFDKRRITMDTVDIAAASDASWATLLTRARPTQTANGVTLVMDGSYWNGYLGPVTGRFTGVTAAGFKVVVRSISGGVSTDAEGVLNSDGTFSVNVDVAGALELRLTRIANGLPVYRQTIGNQGGPVGLDVAVGVPMLVSLGGPELLATSRLDAALVASDALSTQFFAADQAKAIIAACSRGDNAKARLWLIALLACQDPSGKFPVEINPVTLEGIGGFPVDTQAWCGLALAFFRYTFPLDANGSDALAALTDLLASLSVLSTIGYEGLYSQDRDENFLAYFMLKAAGATTTALTAAIFAKLWVESEARYGLTPSLNPLAAAHLQSAGDATRASLVDQWEPYFTADEKGALGRSQTPPAGVSHQGDISGPATGIWAAGTYLEVLSKIVLGKRDEARALYAGMVALPLTRTEDLALSIIAANPSGFFGLAVDALWHEGPVSCDRTAYYRYQQVTADGSYTGAFEWPISMDSDNAVIRLRSKGALPFAALSGRWEGNFVARDQKV